MITQFALKYNRVTAVLTVLITLLGAVIYLNYPSQEDPTITIRNVYVVAQYPGMSPERVEALIGRKIEEKLREIAEVDEIVSTSKTGSVKVDVAIHDWVTDLDAVTQTIRDKMQDLKPELPDGTIGPIINDEVGLTAVATIALTADGFSMAEMRDAARDMRDRLYALPGIKKIELYGIQDERIYLEVETQKLVNYGLSPGQIFSALADQNIVSSGGKIDAGGRNIVIEPSGNFESIEDIENVLIRLSDQGQLAVLRDVVSVKRGYVDPPSKLVYYNGQPAIILSVSILPGVSSTQFGDSLTWWLKTYEQTLPVGYRVDYATFQPELVEAAVQGAVSNVYQTLVIVLVVVMAFLGLRTGLIVGFFVPLTMLLGLALMRIFEVEFQRMSIAAMIIALGMLVDNGIVIAEDIRVRIGQGMDRAAAALAAGNALALPLLTSSLTTILAFLPMMLADGGAGEYVRSLSQVVTILLLASWLLSMYVTPAMCVWLMPKGDPAAAAEPEREGAMQRGYRGFLTTVMRARYAFLGILIAALAGAVSLLQTVPTEFFPLGDRNQFLVYIDLEAGASIEQTDQVVRGLSDWLDDTAENTEVTSTVAYVGDGGPRFFLSLSPIDPDPQHAFLVVNVDKPENVRPVVDRLNAYADHNIAEARIDAKMMWFGGTETGLMEFRLIGSDADVLMARGDRLVGGLGTIPGVVGVKSDWENPIIKLRVEIDQARANRAGVTSDDIAFALSTFLEGSEVTDYREGDTIIPVVVRGAESQRGSLMALQQVAVYSAFLNSFVPLGQVADVGGGFEVGRIKRRDMERTLTVSARHQFLPADQFLEEARPVLDGLDLPPGYRWELGGELADQSEAQAKLFASLPFCFAAIVLLLIWQFNSLRRALIILITIPMSWIGAIVGLVIMGAPYGFMVLLGFLSLAGIVINNGIVLIDRIEIERAERDSAFEAVVAACLARLRPILMTTLTTVLGLVPLILFGGALFYGMASAIAWGLAIGTVMTLGLVPVLYTLFMRIPVKTDAAAAPAEA